MDRSRRRLSTPYRAPLALRCRRRRRHDLDDGVVPLRPGFAGGVKVAFRTLLTDLGTLTVNTMQVADTGASFPLQTQPTPLQQRCFELLGVTPRT